jgi:hypothetical protein
LPLDLFDQRLIRHLRNLHVFFYLAGFLFQRDQPFDRLGLNTRVLAEERRCIIKGLKIWLDIAHQPIVRKAQTSWE